ncbi:sensor signal transduction histidine kinase [Candidatus Magnetobacterium bavaricum]|uniref:histidine kinase n=1 Tax=Candidatus Magnetobacterium bavaricum TaxID=29290 RepID=A0A0F3GTM7_9BACT|nr:sensor signal transduction histidine kinase [Candidatus Magnetobacterium bavaricum]
MELQTNIEMILNKRKADIELKNKTTIENAMVEASRSLIQTDRISIKEISDLLLHHAKTLTRSVYGYAGYIDTETGVLVVPYLTTDILDKCNIPNKNFVFEKMLKGLVGWMLDNQRPLLTNNPAIDHRSAGTPKGHIPIIRFLSVPALIEGKIVGLLSVANSTGDYTEVDQEVLERLANYYALAIERKRIDEDMEKHRQHLQQKAEEEVAKRQQNEQMLIQQSNLAAMGEMIDIIAHQWKQPLTAIAVVAQDLRDAYKFGDLNEEYIETVIDTTMDQVNFMGKTMDDFRNFFKPSKQKVHFDVRDTINELISMFIPVFKKNNVKINLKTNQSPNPTADGYPNEFKQVILNILNNSKDAIISRRNPEPKLQGLIDVEITNSVPLQEGSAPPRLKGRPCQRTNSVFSQRRRWRHTWRCDRQNI